MYLSEDCNNSMSKNSVTFNPDPQSAMNPIEGTVNQSGISDDEEVIEVSSPQYVNKSATAVLIHYVSSRFKPTDNDVFILHNNLEKTMMLRTRSPWFNRVCLLNKRIETGGVDKTIYEYYVRSNVDLRIAISKLIGKRLVCSCNGNSCHGLVLLKLIDEFKIQGYVTSREHMLKPIHTVRFPMRGGAEHYYSSWIDRPPYHRAQARAIKKRMDKLPVNQARIEIAEQLVVLEDFPLPKRQKVREDNILPSIEQVIALNVETDEPSFTMMSFACPGISDKYFRPKAYVEMPAIGDQVRTCTKVEYSVVEIDIMGFIISNPEDELLQVVKRHGMWQLEGNAFPHLLTITRRS